MNLLNARLLRAAVPLALLGAAACAPPSPPVTPFDDFAEGPQPGARIEVQLRRDALGASSDLPIDPTTNVINGAPVSISGELVAVTEDWICIEHKKQRHWILRDCVLLFIEKGN